MTPEILKERIEKRETEIFLLECKRDGYPEGRNYNWDIRRKLIQGTIDAKKETLELEKTLFAKLEEEEFENKQMREVLQRLIDNHIINDDEEEVWNFCKLCNREVSGGHAHYCPIPKIKAILEESKNE